MQRTEREKVGMCVCVYVCVHSYGGCKVTRQIGVFEITFTEQVAIINMMYVGYELSRVTFL